MDQKITFSLLIVCYNAGEKLRAAIENALEQTYPDWEVIIKDGLSTDGSIEAVADLVENDARIKLYQSKDGGIYDAMNQAVSYAEGDYIFFLNCGDALYEKDTLKKVAAGIREHKGSSAAVQGADEPCIFYGDIFNETTGVTVSSPRSISGLTCYRNIPCHQACFYQSALCKAKPFEVQFKVRADYEHFLWCYYQAKAHTIYLPLTVARYEGGGFSETAANKKRNKKEHKEITARYMSSAELFKYRCFMWVTLAPLRSALAESKAFAGVYHKLKTWMYR